MATSNKASAVDTSADDEGYTSTILIVDDHRSFAELLAAALNSCQGMKCVGTASTAAEGIAMAAELRPTVVVMDIQMPRQDGLVAARRIREVAPETVIAVVTAHRDPEWVSRAAQAGASAFIPKDGSLLEMIDVLSRVRQGQMLVAPSTFRGTPVRAAATEQQDVPALTQRELEVLTYLGQGMQAKGIARVLGITLHTCRGYIKSLHSKFGVSTQLETVIKAQHLGLIGSPDEK
jgi:DNA-binding NarL/FixJ family response regulator